MQSYTAILITLVVAFAPIFIAGACLHVWRWYRKQKPLRSPLTRALLRSPGETLRRQVDDLTWDISIWFALLMVLPLMLYAIYLTQNNLGGARMSPWPFSIIALGAFGFIMYRLVRDAQKFRNLRQGLDGERAVGQELTELLKDGMSVFHDVQCGQFNIDHVVIGSAGVFAVETKMRAKLKTGRGKQDAAVKVDGDRLLFPNWTETKWVAQARRQAQWLAGSLSSTTGERVDVKAVLALPGWYIQFASPSDVLVLNPKNPRLIIQADKAPLSAEQVRRVTAALEQRCRDVETHKI